MQEAYSWLHDLIPVSLVKQYAYCPMIPWIMSVTGFTEHPTPSMESGRMDAGWKEAVAERLRLPRPWRVEFEARSTRLGLSGRVDIVAGRGPYVVVEVKRYARRMAWSRHFRAQLMVYALLVNDVLGPVREAVLVMGNRSWVYTVTQEDLRNASRMVEEARRIAFSEEPPHVAASPRMCGYCWYRRFCPASRL